MKLHTLSHWAGLTLLAGASWAQAGVVTFDPVAEQGLTLAAGDSISAQGFVFTQISADPTTLFAGDLTGAYASNGSATLYAANNAAFGIMASGGAAFSLSSLQLGGGNLAFLTDPTAVEPWAASVDLLGVFANGDQQQLSLTVDGSSSGLASFSIGWVDLLEVRFSAQGDYSIDNLDLQTVPEPAGLAWLGLAALGAFTCRCRSARRSRPASRRPTSPR
jgi:hypothetical protein